MSAEHIQESAETRLMISFHIFDLISHFSFRILQTERCITSEEWNMGKSDSEQVTRCKAR